MNAVAILGIATLFLAVAAMVLIIAADRTRYLARYDLTSFADRPYLAALPNFLQYLHDARVSSPFPRHLNAVSAALYVLRVRRVLKAHPTLHRTRFLQNHLRLHALLTILKPFIDDAILLAQSGIASERILTMGDTRERDRLIRFVARARECHIAFHASLTKIDREILKEIRDRNFPAILRAANATFHEHGYDFLPALDVLRHWSALEGAEIAQVLPILPKLAKPAPLPMAPFPDIEAA